MFFMGRILGVGLLTTYLGVNGSKKRETMETHRFR